jgi:predicted GNAT family acetyltransferase
MVKNMKEFVKIPWVREFIEGKSTMTLKKFTGIFNQFLKGKEFRDEFGFDFTDISEADAKDLALFYNEKYHNPRPSDDEIKDKKNLKIRKIKKVPEEMIQKFLHTGGGGSRTYQKITNADVIYGILCKDFLLGFISATFFKEGDVLNVDAIYVDPALRGKGIAKQFIYRIIKESKRRKLSGVDIDEMVFETKWSVESLKKRVDTQKNPPFTIELSEDEDYGFCAAIRFK